MRARTALDSLVLVSLVAALAATQSGGAHAGNRPTCFGEPATIVEHGRWDDVTGTEERDVIVVTGYGTVRALGGDDLVCTAGDVMAGPGNDRVVRRGGPDPYLRGGNLRGGPGHDKLFRREPRDSDPHFPVYTYGGAGDDLVQGGQNLDSLRGGRGHDRVVGGGLSDVVIGGPGMDVLLGNRARDHMRGSAGADRMLGGLADDDMRGLAGADRIVGNAGDDEANGGDGIDSCSAESVTRCE